MLDSGPLGRDVARGPVLEVTQHLPANGRVTVEQPVDHTHRRRLTPDRVVAGRPTDQFWGTWDFAVRDPFGNLVRIDQPPVTSS